MDFMNRLLQRLRAPIEQWSTDAIKKALPRSKASFRCRLLRELGERKELQSGTIFVAHLNDSEPGIRRAAAHGLGLLERATTVDNRIATEPCTTVKLELAKTWVLGGGKSETAQNFLSQHAQRNLNTHTGTRQPALFVAQDEEVLLRALGNSLKPVLSLSPTQTPDQTRAALSSLAYRGRPSDFDTLKKQLQTGGRRMEHIAIALLGLHGDPRSLKPLCKFLSEMSVDPARGFAHRRTAAIALGRLGLKEAGPPLLRALRQEPADHEGRPGAGLGIQYPVRTNIIWALGEIQEERAIPALIELLKDDAGSPLGGFYCVAMDALVKIGPAARPRLEHHSRSVGRTAENAAGVLAALKTIESNSKIQ
jgi:HEAT repeat protein